MSRVASGVITTLATLFLLLSVGRVAMAATVYDTPTNSEFKAYMDYRTITNTKSKQYILQQQATTDANGLRVYDGRYCIAVGTYFSAEVGTYVDVQLTSGVVLKCVIGDIKQNIHTDARNLQCSNGNIVEFIVDVDGLESRVKSGGTISRVEGMEGGIKTVTVYDKEEIENGADIRVIQDIKQVELPDRVITEVSYSGDTDVTSVYTDEEVFETKDAETFVTYDPDEEVVFIY